MVKFSVSNIAWTKEYDEEMYRYLKQEGFEGIEIAPTRIFPEKPYEKIEQASQYATYLKDDYDLNVSSIQSIWFGRKENIFSSLEERQSLLHYTKQAIDFASSMNCHNLVFGCPKNRAYDENADLSVAIPFFKELGDYAYSKKTALAMEANPPIYQTNFINSTKEAIGLIKKVDSKGFLLNLDIGTMIENNETVDAIENNFDLINHIHVSEPNLVAIQKRELHQDLAKLMNEKCYAGYVSLELKTQDSLEKVKDALGYMKDVFED